MFRRILIAATTAAALLTGAPALGEQRERDAEPQKVSPCCERYTARVRELEARVQAAEKKATASARAEPAAPATTERHSVLDESW